MSGITVRDAHMARRFSTRAKFQSSSKSFAKKINEILADTSPVYQTSLFPIEKLQGQIRLYDGSCLQILPQLPERDYDAIMTSPPYCNRYDYTRTYALELALLGIDEDG